MDVTEVVGLAGVPVIIALVEVFKAWVDDSRWYPVFALVVGLTLNVGFVLVGEGELARAVIYGLVAGLAAAGLYSGAKAQVKVG